MRSDPDRCRLCGDGRIRCLGAVPDSDYFAGRVLQHPIRGGHLWICDVCESMFRHPVLPVSAYLDLYSQGTSGESTADAGRQDLAIIRSTIGQNHGALSRLDVGCGDGDFLATLPAKMEKYRIEPSLAAATAERNRGVSMLAPTVAQLPPQETFDVITMIDVIEHVAEPGDLLDQVRTHLAPGGCMIVATGDAGNVLWRRVFEFRDSGTRVCRAHHIPLADVPPHVASGEKDSAEDRRLSD